MMTKKNGMGCMAEGSLVQSLNRYDVYSFFWILSPQIGTYSLDEMKTSYIKSGRF